MAGKRAAHRYAKALLSIAKENQQLEKIDGDIRLVQNTLTDSKELRVVLKSPVIRNEVKLESLKEIFKNTDSLIQRLFDVLLANNRIELLPQITAEFIQLVDAENKVIKAEVTTATPLDAEMEKKILAKVKELTGSKASLIKKVDDKLIGGFLLRVGDLQYDASIAGKLKKLKQNFKQNAYI